jgi:hypothetical protein
MLNDRLAAAQLIADKLASVENAIDDALISGAELTSAFPAARRRARVSPVVGQDAIALTAEAMSALHEARSRMVAAHHALAEVRDAMGVPARLGGDLWKIMEEPADLRIVGQNAA